VSSVQIMHSQSRPSQFYLIDLEVINGKVPYGENFYVMSRYCLSRVTNSRCRLVITSQIKYRTTVWGFVRNIIDKNVTAGIIEYLTALGTIFYFSAKICLHLNISNSKFFMFSAYYWFCMECLIACDWLCPGHDVKLHPHFHCHW